MKIGTDFSGIGSPEMALKLLNIEHEQVFACEIDKYARKSFEAIHGKPQTFYKDITKRDHSEIPQLDLYVAGFPCQAFSMAGKRKGFDDVRGTLFFNVAEFIKINQPKCFILENVKGLLSHDGGKTFQTIISLLTDNGGTANGQIFIPYFEDGLGYHVYYRVLNTKDYGIPQNRERIFIVGFKEFREFSFPKPFSLELRLKDMLQDNPDYKYFLSESAINSTIANALQCPGNSCGIYKGMNAIKVPSATKKGYEEVVVKQINPSKESGGKQPYQQNRIYDTDGISPALNANLSTGGNMIVAAMRGRYDENKKIQQELEINATGTTNSITTAQKDNLLIKDFKIRRLTPLECFRLQGFPDDAFFRAEKVNSDTQLYKQAGNSITTCVMVELFKKILYI